MVIEQEQRIGKRPIEKNLEVASARLEGYLRTPEEAILREHQADAMESLRDFLGDGQSAGYISLPTGSGKTVLATEIAKVLGLKTVILSPTQTILRQTDDTFKSQSPGVNVSNFYQGEKDLSGQVLNTTYQSFLVLLEKGVVKPEDIQLVIADELHTALGEQRHKIFSQLSNAIQIGLTATPYFGPLEGYKKRGLVDEGEPWVKMFKDCIHEMSLEEAIERKILSPIDVHLLRTGTKVDDIDIRQGEYSKEQLNRYFNTQARNALTVAMIAGLDKIDSGINLDLDQRQQIKDIHEKIQGKRTVIFGVSIAHVESLAKQLKDKGLSAEPVHSGLNIEERREILSAHSRGEIQVVLGVDLLRLGWDSPPTEVGIYLAPTQSGIVAVQELGRILRLSPETDKEEAIAVQFVDQFAYRSQAPILIPNIFDPYYVLRGTQTGELQQKKGDNKHAKGAPITFSGLHINAIIEEARTNELLRTRFKQSSIKEMAQMIDDVIADTQEKVQVGSALSLIRELTRSIPRVGPKKQGEALQAIASIDSNAAEIGRKVLVFTSLSTILNAIEPYLEKNSGENDDIVQASLEYVLSKTATAKPNVSLSQYIYGVAREGAAQFISERDNLPVGLVKDIGSVYKQIRNRIDELMVNNPKGMSDEAIKFFANEIALEFSLAAGLVEAYINYRNSLVGFEVQADDYSGDDSYFIALRKDLEDAILGLTYREQKVIKLRFGLEDGKERTLDEVRKDSDLGVTRERIRQIEARALRKIKINPRTRSLLRGYLDLTYLPMDIYDYPPPVRQREQEEFRNIIERRKTAKQRWQQWESENPWPKNLPLKMQNTFYQNFVDGVSDERIEELYKELLALSKLKEPVEKPVKWERSEEKPKLSEKEKEAQLADVSILKSEPETVRINLSGREVLVRNGLLLEEFLQTLQSSFSLTTVRAFTSVRGFGALVGSALSKPLELFTDGEISQGKRHSILDNMNVKDARYVAWIGERALQEDEMPIYIQTKLPAWILRDTLKRHKIKSINLRCEAHRSVH